MQWQNNGGNMQLKELIEELRKIQNSLHNHLLEADGETPLLRRVHTATTEAANALQEWRDKLKEMKYPGIE